MLSYELLLAFTVLFFGQNVSNLREGCRKQPLKVVLVVSGEGRSLALEFDVDDGVLLGLRILVNLHKLFCDKSVVSGCVDASLHKLLVRYPNPVLVVDTIDECLSKWSVAEEGLEWKIIFSSFDGCKSALNDWKNPSSSVDARCGKCRRTCSGPVCCLVRRRGSSI